MLCFSADWWSVVSVLNKVIFAIGPILTFILLTYRLGEFYDVYGIKKEIFGQFLSTIVLFVLYGLISAATTSSDKEIQTSIGCGVFVLLYCVFGITSVYHPIYLVKQEMQKNTRLHLTSSSSCQSNTIAGLLDALKDERIFSLFMQHLVKEFATENLLFIVELCQIKHYYLLRHNNVLKISNKMTDFAQLSKKDSLSVQGGQNQSVENVATSSRVNDKYIVIDFNTCVYDANDNMDTIPHSPNNNRENTQTSSFIGKRGGDRSSTDKNEHLISPSIATTSSRQSVAAVTNNMTYKTSEFSRTLSIQIDEKSRHILTYLLNDSSTYDMLQLEIPSKVPTSCIITEKASLYDQMVGLSEKYVKSGSIYEINIPYNLREDVEIYLKCYHESSTEKSHPAVEMIEGDLFWIMDECCLNIFRLLLSPFRRFKLSEPYQKYLDSMEHHAKSANVEFTEIIQQQVTSTPKLHSGASYDRLASYYQNR